MYNNKRKRKDSIKFYKCYVCNHVSTSRARLTGHTRTINHLINNYGKHKNHEHDIEHYNGLLMNEKLDDFTVDEDMMKIIDYSVIKTFQFHNIWYDQ